MVSEIMVSKLTRRVAEGLNLAPEVQRHMIGTMVFGPHFDRSEQLCGCCEVGGLVDYKRVRYFRLNENEYLMVANKAVSRTLFSDNTKTERRAYGIETDYFPLEILEETRIFQIDRTKLDRTDLTKGQEELSGLALASVITALLEGQGTLETIVEYLNSQNQSLGFYLSGEPRPTTASGYGLGMP